MFCVSVVILAMSCFDISIKLSQVVKYLSSLSLICGIF